MFRFVDVSPCHDIRVCRLVMYAIQKPPRRDTGIVVGIDREITNLTVVAKTDFDTTDIPCYDTAVQFRDNPTWNDRERHAISYLNRK